MKRLLLSICLSLFFLMGCKKQLVKDPTLTSQVFSLQKLSCQGCGARVARVLKQKKGIVSTRFEKTKVELYVTWKKNQTNAKNIIAAVKGMGFTAQVGAGKGAYLPPIKFDKGMNVQWISKKGEAVELAKHIAKGKVTVFDFYATWCGPCKDVDRELYKLMKKHPQIALRKLNVVDWDRPLAKQHLKKVTQLPYLIIYDQKGKKVRSIVGRKLTLLRSTLASLLKNN